VEDKVNTEGMSFEAFKEEFLDRAREKLREWSERYGVEPPGLYVLRDEEIERFFPSASYVMRGWRSHSIKGPAILFAEAYLRDVYDGMVGTGKYFYGWNVLTWTLAHEFGHHVSYEKRPVKVSSVAEFFRLLPELIRRREISASLIAYNLTGKTRGLKNYEFRVLTGMGMLEYWRKRREEWVKAQLKILKKLSGT